MDFTTPQSYYTQHKLEYETKAKQLKKQMLHISVSRLITFLLTLGSVYATFNNWQLAVGIIILGVVIFIYLLSKYSDIKAEHTLYGILSGLNNDEIKIATGDFLGRDQGLEFQDAAHHFSLDIDLFGRGSLFQYINRTALANGKSKLANLLMANNTNEVVERQNAIQELSAKPKWRQFYTAHALRIQAETPSATIVHWLAEYKSFLPDIMRWLPIGFGVCSLLIIMLSFINLNVFQTILVYWLLFGLAITGAYVKRINTLSNRSDKMKETFRQYAVLLDMIENEVFKSKVLQNYQHQITLESEKASQILKKISRYLDGLDNRNNIIGAIFGNGLFLRDIWFSMRIELWIQNYGSKIEDWFNTIHFFDAYNSLGNFTFNHPEFTFPEIVDDTQVIHAKNLGHPLLNITKRVNSDLTINGEQFFIVTGANMAGKSTFLRTVALHIVMANTGLPVCASSSTYNPVKLITSMRTTDSLTDESSYFFSELTRLKFIVDEITTAPYFVVLDEILKGTNSIDKARGSKKFVEKLVATNATGIIATHDLSLCEIASELDEVENFYFDAEIVNDELYFDYKLKAGVCKNMNASFLLKIMNIVN